jgi:predicted DNA-binding protein
MTTAVIRRKLVNYLQTADDKKVKAIYTMVEEDINAGINDVDDAFLTELQTRSQQIADGTAKTYSWEETKKAAKNTIKK